MLAAVEPVDGAPVGLIVPHAGYIFSGPVAATGFAQLGQGQYEVAVIIAADHRRPLSKPISVWAEGSFQTPLGTVPVDRDLAHALLAAHPSITFDADAHEGEHSIEIELPFLQRVCPHCRIVPVLMGADDDETVRILAEALLETLPGKRAVVIASSDLSHYPSHDDALTVDGATLGAIETGDPARVRKTMREMMSAGFPNLVTCACGEAPILVVMRVARGLGADVVTVLRYANSGQTPQGDRERVVGYGAVMFWRYEPPDLTEFHRQELLTLGRTAIRECLKRGRVPEYQTDDPVLTRRTGTFVTLRKGGELRGRIGRLERDEPLYRVVQEMAISAATADARFSPLRRVVDRQQIEIGTHGLLIVEGERRGVLLPQVPVERGWGREEFLGNLCLKAGLPSDCWTDEPTLYAFTAAVIEE